MKRINILKMSVQSILFFYKFELSKNHGE